MNVLELASGAGQMFLSFSADDEFADRLNYRYTVGLLMFLTIILSTKQYSADNIKCWVPAHLVMYEDYVSEICWVTNTYYVPLNATIPKSEIDRQKTEIKYYQWVSFVLIMQAFLFYMPRVFWTSLAGKGGLYLSDLVQAARNYKSGDKFYKKTSYMEYLVLNIDQFVDDQRRWDHARSKSTSIRMLATLFPCFGRFLGNYVLGLYLVTKCIYILNTVIQVSVISVFLGENFWMFGINHLWLVLRGRQQVTSSKYFPKVTLCDFMIRELGNPNKGHRYTVECVLPTNLLNQQVFTLIWFWYIILLAANCISLAKWFARIVPSRSKKWIKQRTNLFNQNVNQKRVPKRLKHFLQYYLEPDGIFMIRMIGNNTSDYVATDLIHQLWCQHDEKYGHLFPDEPHESARTPCSFRHSAKNECKSNNHVFRERSYTEARLAQYARKHKTSDKNPPAEEDIDFYSRKIRQRLEKVLAEMDGERAKVKSVPPLINDSTTNSDDSDSHEEQAFHQHHSRIENQEAALTSARADRFDD